MDLPLKILEASAIAVGVPLGFYLSPYYVVNFDDGSIWSTRNNFYRADQNLKLSDEKGREILAFVAEKCGKEIERYDFLKKDEDR
jgi:hypothetical protein